MALTLIHNEFKTLLESVTTLQAYPISIPEKVQLPAIAYGLEGLQRDVESNLSDVSLVVHVYNVHVVSKTFSGLQQEVQSIVNGLDQHHGGRILLALVEDVIDSFNPDFDVYTSTIQVTVRTKEN